METRKRNEIPGSISVHPLGDRSSWSSSFYSSSMRLCLVVCLRSFFLSAVFSDTSSPSDTPLLSVGLPDTVYEHDSRYTQCILIEEGVFNRLFLPLEDAVVNFRPVWQAVDTSTAERIQDLYLTWGGILDVWNYGPIASTIRTRWGFTSKVGSESWCPPDGGLVYVWQGGATGSHVAVGKLYRMRWPVFTSCIPHSGRTRSAVILQFPSTESLQDCAAAILSGVPRLPETQAQGGQTQAGQTQAGQAQAGQTQAAQTQAAQTRAAQTQAGQTQAGQTQAGQTQAGQTQAGQTQAGQTQAGQTQAGQTQGGQTSGDQPQEEGDEPEIVSLTQQGFSLTAVTFDLVTNTCQGTFGPYVWDENTPEDESVSRPLTCELSCARLPGLGVANGFHASFNYHIDQARSLAHCSVLVRSNALREGLRDLPENVPTRETPGIDGVLQPYIPEVNAASYRSNGECWAGRNVTSLIIPEDPEVWTTCFLGEWSLPQVGSFETHTSKLAEEVVVPELRPEVVNTSDTDLAEEDIEERSTTVTTQLTQATTTTEQPSDDEESKSNSSSGGEGISGVATWVIIGGITTVLLILLIPLLVYIRNRRSSAELDYDVDTAEANSYMPPQVPPGYYGSSPFRAPPMMGRGNYGVQRGDRGGHGAMLPPTPHGYYGGQRDPYYR